ncbi:MAG: hypothetical protein WD031_00855, partial [Gemmatimonadota bacterium]
MTLAIQETVQGLGEGAVAAEFEPTLLGLIVLLPLIGFVINGIASLVAARKATVGRAPLGTHHEPSEVEAGAHEHAAVPWTHRLPSFVAPGVVGLAFVLALVNFFGMLGADLHDPIVERYWSWIPVGDLQVDAALQLDQLSILMTLIITGVGALIHLFSVGYMSHDPGYPRYMAYLNLFVFFML